MNRSLHYVATEIGVTVEDLTGGLNAGGCCLFARGRTSPSTTQIARESG